MGIKRTYLDEFPQGHPKMFERTLDISLFVLAISNTISLFPLFFFFFLLLLFFVCVCAVPYENVRKMKLLHTDCPDLKNRY